MNAIFKKALVAALITLSGSAVAMDPAALAANSAAIVDGVGAVVVGSKAAEVAANPSYMSQAYGMASGATQSAVTWLVTNRVATGVKDAAGWAYGKLPATPECVTNAKNYVTTTRPYLYTTGAITATAAAAKNGVSWMIKPANGWTVGAAAKRAGVVIAAGLAAYGVHKYLRNAEEGTWKHSFGNAKWSPIAWTYGALNLPRRALGAIASGAQAVYNRLPGLPGKAAVAPAQVPADVAPVKAPVVAPAQPVKAAPAYNPAQHTVTNNMGFQVITVSNPTKAPKAAVQALVTRYHTQHMDLSAQIQLKNDLRQAGFKNLAEANAYLNSAAAAA